MFMLHVPPHYIIIWNIYVRMQEWHSWLNSPELTNLYGILIVRFFVGGYTGKDGGKVTTVVATPGQGPDRPQEVSYTDTKVIGNGSFGVVYQAKLCDSGEMVAIKKVLQDKRFKVSALNLISVILFSVKFVYLQLSLCFRIGNCKSCDDWNIVT